jgi:hypothetical protein
MQFRIVTLNLEQDHKRWKDRRPLVLNEFAKTKPDIIALNEVSIVEQSARGLHKDLNSLLGSHYNLVQQTKGQRPRGSGGRSHTVSLRYYRDRQPRLSDARYGCAGRSHKYRWQAVRCLRYASVHVAWRRCAKTISSTAAFSVDRSSQRYFGLHRLRRLQRDAGHAFGSINGEPVSPLSNCAHCVYTTCGARWFDIPSVLAANGPLHRLYLDCWRNAVSSERRVFQSTGR